MGRHKNLVPVTMTTIGISTDTLEIITKFKKGRRETQRIIKKVALDDIGLQV